ncbi:MAG: hypothetical protein KGI02_07655 [Thaumarchaeota archaeon]|nr:hypothetical protein [Nitrososphaerota archaeon]MDE1840886.1 hypothetical protein [Nitrososphaerota archaeon]MDE1877469.1 hypothetical protein [Nitrososphaerota archaeon]
MQRRGISEIYSTVLMFTVALAIAGVVMVSSSDQFDNQQQSAYQMLDSSQKRMSESISLVAGRNTGTGSEVEIVNFGLENINLDRVMVDAVLQQSYAMTFINGTQTKFLPVNEPVIISTGTSGSRMQIVTTYGSVFEFPLQ